MGEAFDDVGGSAAGEDFPGVGFDFDVDRLAPTPTAWASLLWFAMTVAHRSAPTPLALGLNEGTGVQSGKRGDEGPSLEGLALLDGILFDVGDRVLDVFLCIEEHLPLIAFPR